MRWLVLLYMDSGVGLASAQVMTVTLNIFLVGLKKCLRYSKIVGSDEKRSGQKVFVCEYKYEIISG